MTRNRLGSTLAILGAMLFAAPAIAWAQDEHKIIPAQDVAWAAGPASLPQGAEAAVLYGSPAKDGLFALRLKFPAGYRIPPHTHPKPEVVTVISGTLHLGMGEKADRDKTQPLSAGSFFALAPGMAHYTFTDEPTVVQLNSIGPWSINYVNPADDPRSASQ